MPQKCLPEPEDMVRKAVNQAVLCIARSQVIPSSNLLARSSTVTKMLQEAGLEDTPEQRHACVEGLLKSLVNDYGLEPSNERSSIHLNTFDTALQLVQGKHKPESMPARTYDRYRHRAVVMMARRFLEKESATSRTHSSDSEDKILKEALESADDAEEILRKATGKLDLVTLLGFMSAITQICDLDYPVLAHPRLNFALQEIERAPINPVILRTKSEILARLGHVYIDLGQAKPAKQCFLQQIAIANSTNNQALWVQAQHSLGVALRIGGEYTEAVRAYNSALSRVSKSPYPIHNRAWILRDLASALVESGGGIEADSLAKESLLLRDKLGDVSGGMMSREVLARVLIRRRRFDDAEVLLNEAWQMAPTHGFALFKVMLLKTFGRLYASWHQKDRSRDFILQAKRIAIQHGLWHQLSQLN